MKCPKCGYNSFEYYNSCKKCSADLNGYKQTYRIAPIVLPLEAREQKANEFRSASSSNESHTENIEVHDDMFAFDLSDESTPSVSIKKNDDPFNFDDDALPETAPQQTAFEESGFADLLESTSQAEEDPFAFAATPAVSAQPAAPPSVGPGEFDLENFSWDDTPVPTASGGAQADNDGFDSLFGDTGSTAKK